MLERIGDIGALMATDGMLPGDYIRKKVIPKLEKLGMITHEEPKTLRHWIDIVGQDEKIFTDIILGWYKSKHHPHFWNAYYLEMTPSNRALYTAILNECLENGWVWPKVIKDRLTFGSRYAPDEQPTPEALRAGWSKIEDEWDDFVHED